MRMPSLVDAALRAAALPIIRDNSDSWSLVDFEDDEAMLRLQDGSSFDPFNSANDNKSDSPAVPEDSDYESDL